VHRLLHLIGVQESRVENGGSKIVNEVPDSAFADGDDAILYPLFSIGSHSRFLVDL